LLKKNNFKLSDLPNTSGVYLMKDARDKIIYIGKAKKLRNRVKNYFTGTIKDLKTQKLVENVTNFDYILTNTETEALILEDSLIKKHRPKYNILLKDDKRYPFLKLTKESFPRLIITRQKKKNDGFYFGPYTDIGSLKYTKRLIHEIFSLRLCTNMGKKPCLNYQIDKCLAPCGNKISQKKYMQIISQVRKFLNGKNTLLLSSLKKQMLQFSTDLNFKKAQRIKKQIDSLVKIAQKQTVYFKDEKNRDVVCGFLDNKYCAMAVLRIIEGRLISKETYLINNIENKSYSEILSAFLKLYYIPKLHTLPYAILIDKQTEDFQKLKETLPLFIPQKGKLKKLLFIASKNAFDHIEQEKLKYLRSFAQTVYPIQELKQKLSLTTLPLKIACIDISTIQGVDTVASLVFFENGKPQKKSYMHFEIKSVQGQDDFAAMSETLKRYLTKIRQYDRPDLIVVDGGKGHLSASKKVLEEFREDIQIISLAKREEEIFLPSKKNSIILSKKSFALKLLIKIRNEAHRFAITYHRKKRKKRTLRSKLDEIVGENKKFTLLQKFGSIKNIKKASIPNLLSVKGIGKVLAQKIKNNLQ